MNKQPSTTSIKSDRGHRLDLRPGPSRRATTLRARHGPQAARWPRTPPRRTPSGSRRLVRPDPGAAAARRLHRPGRAHPRRRPRRARSASASPPAPTTSANSPRSASSPSTRSAPPSVVTVNPACCTGLPHAADVVMGTLAVPPCCPEDLPADVTTRAMTDDDLPVVRDIYAEGIATRNATFETEVPDRGRARRRSGCPGTAGSPSDSTAARSSAGPRSARSRARDCYAGVGETSGLRRRGRPRPRRRQGAAVPPGHRGRRRRPLDAADLDLPREPRLHRPAPRGRLPAPSPCRSRIAKLDGVWRDTGLHGTPPRERVT